MAVVIGIAAAALGVRQPLALFLVVLAAFGADMNIRAVVRKIENGKLLGAGGYLAHTGFGIMLAGIVVSGIYARSSRITLPINRPVAVGGSTLTFLRVVPGTADEKQAMEVLVGHGEGQTYYAYPKMYINSRTGQMMANPAIRHSAVADFYMSPQAYDPGQPERIGQEVRLTKGTTTKSAGRGLRSATSTRTGRR